MTDAKPLQSFGMLEPRSLGCNISKSNQHQSPVLFIYLFIFFGDKPLLLYVLNNMEENICRYFYVTTLMFVCFEMEFA